MNTKSINRTIISKKLMLGDYVNINDGFYPLVAKVSGVGGWTTVDNETVPAIEYVIPSSSISVVCAISKVSPISVNADFLEKNGFAYNETTEKYIYRHKDHSFDIMIEYSLSSHLLAVEKVSFPLQSFNVEKIYKKCEHLHVLQQTLRLLDIPVLIRP